MRTWFTAALKDGAPPAAEIAIYDWIGDFGISAEAFRDALAALGDVKQIDLRVNSGGGQVFDGIAIANMLARHPARIVATVDGIAASIASLVCMAADEVAMPENAMMMIHNPAGLCAGTADDMRDWADALDKMSSAMIASYTRKSGRPPAEIAAMLDAETWLTAAEAKEKGFADTILPARKMQASLDPARYKKMPATAIALVTAAAAAEWTVGAAEDLAIDMREAWDGPAAAARMLAAAGFDGPNPDPAKARRGFLAYDHHNAGLKGSYKLPFADIIGGELKAVSGGLRAAASRLPNTDIPDQVRTRARAVIDTYERRMRESEGAQGSSTNPEPGDDAMADQAALEKAAADAVAADRARTAAVMALPEAKGREALAQQLALKGLDAEAAKDILAAAPKASALEERAGGFNPAIGAGGGNAAASALAQINQSWTDIVAGLNRENAHVPGFRVPAR